VRIVYVMLLGVYTLCPGHSSRHAHYNGMVQDQKR
jgi:hypothetical protein